MLGLTQRARRHRVYQNTEASGRSRERAQRSPSGGRRAQRGSGVVGIVGGIGGRTMEERWRKEGGRVIEERRRKKGVRRKERVKKG